MSIYIGGGGTLAGVQISASALYAMQAAFEVTQQNISNENTPGYTRQEIVLGEASPYTTATGTPDQPNQPMQFGYGVQVVTVNRTNQEWLDNKLRGTNMTLGDATQSNALLQQAETLFNDNSAANDSANSNPSAYGLNASLSNYFNSWQNVGNFPEDTSQRQTLLQRAQELASQFNSMYSGLEGVKSSADTLVAADVTKVNGLIQHLGALNEQIEQATAVGEHPNDLEDQADNIVTQLSQYGNFNTIVQPDGTQTLYLGGQTLLQDDENVLGPPNTTPGNVFKTVTDANGHLQVAFAGTGQPATFTNGELYGLINTRDVTIPNYENQLNTLAQEIVTKTNALQTSGFDLNGNPGQNFFNPIAAGAPAALNISVALTDPTQIAAAATAAGAPGDGSNAFNEADVATANNPALNGQQPSGYYSTLVAQVGTDVKTTNDTISRVQASQNQINQQIQSVSGVNLDEEFVNLTKFQQAYQAAARCVTNYDDMLSQVIQHTGRAGL